MTSPLKVLIADDEAPARDRLKELLGDLSAEVPTSVVGEARNGLEVLQRVQEGPVQVLLLDIEMPGMNGLEAARHLAGLSGAPAVIFTTAHDRHAVEAFELNALDYLLKPVRAARLATALKKALHAGAPDADRLSQAAEQIRNAGGPPREYLSVTERNRIVLVQVHDIVYFKADMKYVTLRTREREFLIEESLIALEREFAHRFSRIHRNCLVARDAIRGFERAIGEEQEPHWLVVIDGIAERLPVSRRQWSALRELVAERDRK